MARGEKPWRWRMASSSNRFQNWKPTWTGPADRTWVMAMRSVWTAMRSPSGSSIRRRAGVLVPGAGLPLPDLADDLLDFGIGLGEEVGLADEGVFDLAGQSEPILGGPGAEITEGADDLLAGAIGSMDGLNQQVVGVSLILVSAGGLSHVHSHYGNAQSGESQGGLRGISHYNGRGRGKARRKLGV